MVKAQGPGLLTGCRWVAPVGPVGGEGQEKLPGGDEGSPVLLVGGSLSLSPVVAPTRFCLPCQHPGGSPVRGSLDLSEVHEVSFRTGHGLLALQAAEGI